MRPSAIGAGRVITVTIAASPVIESLSVWPLDSGSVSNLAGTTVGSAVINVSASTSSSVV